ncbi:Mrp/NBP35 family ATP-binding protein [bacterium SCSIO 12643]|nr:Mrp/NBP35 family ATP-binding protein [bacterium SCSIO 12643]
MHSKQRMEEAVLHYLKIHVSEDVEVEIDFIPLDKHQNKREPSQRKMLHSVKNIIAVASGKGGVGKSTITANIAAGLAKKGYKVGLIDADIYGPSMPLMFDEAQSVPGGILIDGKQKMTPVESSWGVDIMSIGFFAQANQAVVWRGPMVDSALKQMANDTHWGDLDYMLIDLPPGTGDVHLTLVQNIPLTGIVIVSTPQPVALADARKAVGMFNMDGITSPILGLVENMSYFVPEDMPEKKYHIFGKDGAKNLAEELNVPLLAQIPLVTSVREAGDAGRPAVLQNGTPQAEAFMDLVNSVESKVNELAE